jgi:P-type Cu2+ transporter
MTDVRLAIGGIGCAACAIEIERVLRTLPGLSAVRVDPATAEARFTLDDHAGSLESAVAGIRKLGYRATPAGSQAAAATRLAERRAALKRLAVAGFGMMQAMMFAFALYAAEDYRIDPAIVRFMQYLSLIVTVPVVVYAGAPIFAAAMRQLRSRRPGMDVPVAGGIGVALAASVFATLAGQGPVYYDAVTMFIFFLGTSRFIEMGSRHQVSTVTEALAWLLPVRALRARGGRTEIVPVGALRPGDEIVVNRGDLVAADGCIVAGSTSFEESLLTGESRPVARGPGDAVPGGSINLGDSVRVRITATGEATALADVLRLMDRSRQVRPRVLTLADQAARWFAVVLLSLAALTAVVWWVINPATLLPAVIAVLVVACPCALALAAPTGMAVANARLARLGLLAVSDSAVEQLACVDYLIVDKTGTLTAGRPTVTQLSGPADALAMAAALERQSSHPLAAAFRVHEDPAVIADGIREMPGEGIRGRLVAGSLAGMELRLGSAAGNDLADPDLALFAGDRVLATFRVEDPVRSEAAGAIAALRALGIEVEIASGDRPAVVGAVAAALGIARWQARLTPGDKVARVQTLQAAGRRVLMVGDGINDAPVLAVANAAVVMRSGSALAQSCGDLLMLDRAWSALPEAIRVARAARLRLTENLRWSVVYNLAAAPLAAAGLVAPWLAPSRGASSRGASTGIRRWRVTILYMLIPLSLVLVVGAVAAFFWAVDSGQFDDFDAAATSVLADDEDVGADVSRRPPAA